MVEACKIFNWNWSSIRASSLLGILSNGETFKQLVPDSLQRIGLFSWEKCVVRYGSTPTWLSIRLTSLKFKARSAKAWHVSKLLLSTLGAYFFFCHPLSGLELKVVRFIQRFIQSCMGKILWIYGAIMRSGSQFVKIFKSSNFKLRLKPSLSVSNSQKTPKNMVLLL